VWLCPICAGELPPAAWRCPRCSVPVSPGIEQVVAAWEPDPADGWSPAPPMAPPAPGAGPGPESAPGPASRPLPGPAGASRPAERRAPVRRDWPGALRSAGLAALAGYILAAALAVLLVPTGSPTLLLWVSAPAALVAVALGGSWQASMPVPDGEVAGSGFGYQAHAFPLLLTGLLGLVLARTVHARFETGRCNDTLRERLLQASRVAATLAGCGLVAGLLSRYPVEGGMVTHAGYLAAPAGGLLLGLVVAGLVAVGYDLSQLPPGLRALWLGLRAPTRILRQVLLVTSVAGLLCTLVALETTSTDSLAFSGEDRRVLSGLAIATAPNLGWWLLLSCLGVPVRADLLAGQPGTEIGPLLDRSGWWLPGLLLAAALLVTAAVRLLSGAAGEAAARRRLLLWVGLVAATAVGFGLFGVLRLVGGVGLLPLEYEVGASSLLAVVAPPLWAALAGLAGYWLRRRRRAGTRPP
jgi:hypothetical protein